MKKFTTLAAKIQFVLLTGFFILAGATANAQEIDASKPTNFYTQLINNAEYVQNKTGGNLIGYRGEILFAPSEKHLILGELPVLYNDQTQKFGLGDIRARYFYLPYKDYTKTFGAFGPSVDVFMPTGSFEDGLGTSSWTIVPGITAGIMAAEWIQFFPIVSYQYVTKPQTDSIPDAFKMEGNGMTFQVITPIVFSPELFAQVTPIYQMPDFNNDSRDGYVQEVLLQYALTPSVQLSGFFRGDFNNETYSYRLGAVVFL
ncbi:MAG: hypothetical protein SchgKO_12600 [Schleiferiaceae bacterium]